MAMDFQELRLIPGFNSEKTPTLNQAGIVTGQLVRWKDGLVEKLGGWAKLTTVNIGSVPRAITAWQDLDQNLRLAIGATQSLKVAIFGPGAVAPNLPWTDITPQETVTSGAPNFATTAGSPVVTIVDVNIVDPSSNDWIFISDNLSVGGLGLYGAYQVQSVLNSDTYTINATSNAPSTAALVSAPSAAPTLSQTAGGSLAATTYFVETTYVNPSGETTPSPEASLAVSVNNVLVVTSPPASGTATAYNVYVSTTTGTETLQNSTPIAIGTNWTEPTSGLVSLGIFSALPTNNSTGGSLPKFGITAQSTIVDIVFENHNLNQGQDIFLIDPTTIPSSPVSFLQGAYEAQSIISANEFTIVIGTLPLSTEVTFQNAGNLTITYFIAIGPQNPSAAYGTGNYGAGGYGIGIPSPQGTGTPIAATDYTLLNFGEDLIANPAGQPLFQWAPQSGLNEALIIGQAPTIADGIFLAQPEQILVAWGASFSGVTEPLRLQWSDAGNFLQWTPTVSNFAGGFTISRGSRIVGCVQAPNQFVVLTDIGCWSGQYVGQPLVFSIIEIMEGCGLIGRKAVGVANTTIYWASQNQFFQLQAGGVPQPLPCRVWDYFFQQIDKTNLDKVVFFSNSAFNEVGWFFPLAGGNGECTNYIKYNTVEQEWDFGPMIRSAWLDQSILGPPIGASWTGYVYQHEISPDADNVAMTSFVVTGDFTVGKGEEFAFIDMWIPDARFGYEPAGGASAGTLLYMFQPKNFPSDGNVVLLANPGGISSAIGGAPPPITISGPPSTIQGPFAVTSLTPFIEPRLRCRQLAMLIGSQDLGSFWRIGLNRFRVAPDGRNPT